MFMMWLCNLRGVGQVGLWESALRVAPGTQRDVCRRRAGVYIERRRNVLWLDTAQMLRPQVGVSLEHLPIFVPSHKRNLLDGESCLEKATGCFVP